MSRAHNQHEDFGRESQLQPGSTRAFALTMAGAFLLVGAVVALRYGVSYFWFVGVAALFLLLELLAEPLLRPLNRGWFRLGLLLGRIVSPLVLGLVFVLVVTPTGLLRRLLGKRSFEVSPDRSAATYWHERDPPGPEPTSLNRQF